MSAILGWWPAARLLALALLVISLASPADAAQKHFLWKVRSPKATVFLLGSIHYLRSTDYPLDRTIEDAYAESDTLVVEANINDPAGLDAMKLLSNSFYPEGDSLENHVTAETMALVRREASALGLPLEFVGRQRPWMFSMTLSALELMRAGYDPLHGVDMYFLSRVTGGKKVAELESLDYQVTFFSQMTDREQEALLAQTLRERSNIATEADAVVRAWKQGEASAVESVIGRSSNRGELAAVYARLLDARNIGMTSKIEGYLRTGGRYFVVVGAGHLVGRRGIVELLRQRGYAPEQL